MRLNKVLVLIASNISIPPLVPFIIYFSYRLGGIVLNSDEELTWETLLQLKQQIMEGNFYHTFQELGYSILQYVAGAVVLAAVVGIFVGVVSWLILKISTIIKRKN